MMSEAGAAADRGGMVRFRNFKLAGTPPLLSYIVRPLGPPFRGWSMGNTVSYNRRPDVEPLEMNSGLTSVFVSTLALAASRLAQSEHQKELAAWFGSRDQNVFGAGIVGFDVGDIPWSSHGFPEDRAFVLQTIEAAKARTGWEALGYEPRVDWLTASLDHFARMVEAFSPEDIAGSEKRSWPWGKPDQWILCGKHMVFQHIAGCVVCND